jgi:hypothetical protein
MAIIDIENNIRPFSAVAKSDLFSNRKVVLFRVFPVDELDSLKILARFRFDRDAIAEQLVDIFIVGIEAFVVVVGGNPQFVQCPGDLGWAVPFFL